MSGDERAAVQDYMCPCEGVWSGKNIQLWLAAQGLHVVTAADMRVLEACADCQLRYIKLHAKDGMGSAWVCRVAEAELARRERKR